MTLPNESCVAKLEYYMYILSTKYVMIIEVNWSYLKKYQQNLQSPLHLSYQLDIIIGV